MLLDRYRRQGRLAFDDLAPIYAQNPLAAQLHVLAVGDQEGGATLGEAAGSIDDRLLGGEVDGARGFIHDQDRSVLKKRPSEGDPLTLAPRERHPRSPTCVS